MKKLISCLSIFLIVITGCQEDDIKVFDKTADERKAEAIAALKADLVAPENGWRVKYRPTDEMGSYYVFMKFHDNNKVNIKTDLGANDGEFLDHTIGYRIDSSLGLELIFENYSFFSYLFELNEASFGAEFEFHFANRTPDGALVFSSKSDLSTPTTLLLEVAGSGDEALLGGEVGVNLYRFADDLDRFSSALKLTYLDKDLVFYLSLDATQRIATFNLATRKSDPQAKQNINISAPYFLEGNALVLETPVTTTITGTSEQVNRITLNSLGETSLSVCAEPFTVHTYTGEIASSPIVLETTIADLAGATFADLSDIYVAPLSNIRRNGLPLVDEITTDVAGAVQMNLYYGLELEEGGLLYGIGFVILNENGTITFALREFTPVLNGNQITFNFEPDYTLFGEPVTDAVVSKTDKYLNALTEGNNTFVYKFSSDLFEFNNPCTGWSFVFVNAN